MVKLDVDRVVIRVYTRDGQQVHQTQVQFDAVELDTARGPFLFLERMKEAVFALYDRLAEIKK